LRHVHAHTHAHAHTHTRTHTHTHARTHTCSPLAGPCHPGIPPEGVFEAADAQIDEFNRLLADITTDQDALLAVKVGTWRS